MPLDVCSDYTLLFNCQATVPGLMAAALHIQLAAHWVSGASFVHASAVRTNLGVWGDSGLPSSLCPLKLLSSAPRHGLATGANNSFQENSLKWDRS